MADAASIVVTTCSLSQHCFIIVLSSFFVFLTVKYINIFCFSFSLQILSKYKFFIQPFYNLKSLELHTSLNKSNVQALACLLRSCPTLHTFILEIINDYKIERKVSYILIYLKLLTICYTNI